MSREIKFRAWSEKVGMRNLDVLALSECAWSCPDYGKNGASIPAQPSIKVMQFTGLKDKNGKEIYEGDIITIRAGHPYWLDKKFEIVFYEGAFCMKPKVIGLLDKPVSFIYYGDMAIKNGYQEDFGIYIEVIGNIYQNPELLKD